MKRKGDDPSNLPSKRPRAQAAGNLPELLNLSDLDLAVSSTVATRFDQIANTLLHDYLLVIAGSSYRILELEFYLRATGHEDPFTHGSEEQRLSGHWYFHRAPRRSKDPSRSLTSLTGYRGGTRKGLDLTMGIPAIPQLQKSPYFASDADAAPEPPSSNEDIRGGILLRSLRRCSDSKVISGPSLLVDEVLRQNAVSRIVDLVDDKWHGERCAFLPTSTLRLERNTDDVEGRGTVYHGPRIGLDLSHPGATASASCPRVSYVSKRYRYFTHPNLLVANGRCQTLLGVYEHIDKTLSVEDICEKLSTLTAIKNSTVAKYLQDYRAGATRSLQAFVGASGKGVCSSPTSYLQMMGAVHAVQAS